MRRHLPRWGTIRLRMTLWNVAGNEKEDVMQAKTFGGWIRQTRLSKRPTWTLADIARRVDKSTTYISNLERDASLRPGKVRQPRVETVDMIAAARRRYFRLLVMTWFGASIGHETPETRRSLQLRIRMAAFGFGALSETEICQILLSDVWNWVCGTHS